MTYPAPIINCTSDEFRIQFDYPDGDCSYPASSHYYNVYKLPDGRMVMEFGRRFYSKGYTRILETSNRSAHIVHSAEIVNGQLLLAIQSLWVAEWPVDESLLHHVTGCRALKLRPTEIHPEFIGKELIKKDYISPEFINQRWNSIAEAYVMFFNFLKNKQ